MKKMYSNARILVFNWYFNNKLKSGIQNHISKANSRYENLQNANFQT